MNRSIQIPITNYFVPGKLFSLCSSLIIILSYIFCSQYRLNPTHRKNRDWFGLINHLLTVRDRAETDSEDDEDGFRSSFQIQNHLANEVRKKIKYHSLTRKV